MLKYWKIGFWQNNEWIWVNEKCSQFWGNMFGRHTIINVKYSGNQRDMKYFCDLNIFGFISNHFWHLHFWTYCIFWFSKEFLRLHDTLLFVVQISWDSWLSLSTLCHRTHGVTTSPLTAGKFLSKIIHQSDEVEDPWDRTQSTSRKNKKVLCFFIFFVGNYHPNLTIMPQGCCRSKHQQRNLLLSISGCSNAYDSKLGSYTHDVLPLAATKTISYGHRTTGNTKFWFYKMVCYSIDLWLSERLFFTKWQLKWISLTLLLPF